MEQLTLHCTIEDEDTITFEVSGRSVNIEVAAGDDTLVVDHADLLRLQTWVNAAVAAIDTTDVDPGMTSDEGGE